MKRVRVVVGGVVQGVGYRYSMRIVAERAGAADWVRNLSDGTVEAEIEGTPEQVDTVLVWMSEGPPGARVASRDVTDLEPAGDSRFVVR